MIVYEFYWCDAIEGYKLIGVLPERRRDPKRITHQSILNMGKKLVGERVGDRNIFFIQKRKDDATGKMLRTNPSFEDERRA